MATRRMQRTGPGLLARLAAEFYVGAVVVGALIVAAAGVAVAVMIAMQVNAWVTAVD
jgi:hypothetical protein